MNHPWILHSSKDEFSKGIFEQVPDATRTALGYAGIIAGYLMVKGKKKK
jgi:hypothetical protein